MIVRREDVISAGFCASGMREWCRANGFSYSDIKNGISSDLLLKTNCKMAGKVVECALKREEMENNDV